MAPQAQEPHGDRARCGARQMQLPHACLPRAAGRGGAARRLRPHRGDATRIRTRRAVRVVAFVLRWRARA